MKREFEPKMTVVRFGAEDVIATSSFSITGFGGDGNTIGNGVISFKGSSYAIADGTAAESFLNIFDTAGAGQYDRNTNMSKPGISTSGGTATKTVGFVVNREGKEGITADWNGLYIFDGTQFVFKQ